MTLKLTKAAFIRCPGCSSALRHDGKRLYCVKAWCPLRNRPERRPFRCGDKCDRCRRRMYMHKLEDGQMSAPYCGTQLCPAYAWPSQFPHPEASVKGGA